MMRQETEKMLANHLMNLAIHERIVENERIELNQIYNFQPNSAFKRIDRYRNYKLNAYDLASFLRDNGYNVYSVDLVDLVNIHDVDKDGGLDLLEFSNLLLSNTDNALRKRARSRYEYQIQSKERLSQDVESKIARIILIEVEGLKELNAEKEVLKSRYDFSRLDSFRAIDQLKMNNITLEDIRLFLLKHDIQSTIADADSIMQRLDKDQDGKVTYTEFAEYIDKIVAKNQDQQKQQENSQNQNQVSQTPQKKQKNRLQDSPDQKGYQTERKKQSEDRDLLNQIERNQALYGIRQQNTTPLKKMSTQNNSNNKSLAKSQTATDLKNGRSSPNYETKNSGQKEIEKKQQNKKKLVARKLDINDNEEEKYQQDNDRHEYQNQNKKSNTMRKSNEKRIHLPPLDKIEEEHLADTLQNIIFLENDIEKVKQQIALKVDFNLLDAFKIFDKHNVGEIYKQDLEDGFMLLGVYGLKKEIELLFKRMDTDCDHKIRYLEFAEAFTPKDKIYANHLQNKKSNNNEQSKKSNNPFTQITKIEFAEVIRSMLKCEGYCEELRQNLAKRQYFSISAGFTTLDINNNGFIQKDEIKQFLEDHEFFATQREIDLVFDKMDRDKDGKIAYGEFFAEIAPKLPPQDDQ